MVLGVIFLEGKKEGSRKISYALRAGNTPYVVSLRRSQISKDL
jgi:hypothetical protein